MAAESSNKRDRLKKKECIMDQQGYCNDKVCIVTGANSGIGYALSEELLKRGATVYMAGRNPEKVAKAAEQLSAYKDRVHTLVVDVTKQEQVQQAIEGTAAEAGRLDMLFNNAGIPGTVPFERATLEDWKNIINTNLWSVIYGVHTAVPIMLKQESGHIVNTASMGGLLPPPMQALYNTAKSGVVALSESLRYEYAEKGLNFSVVCPSVIATPILKKHFDRTVKDEVPIPDDAMPADKAASYILDRVAERKGIIIVPEEPSTEFWKAYVNGNEQVEAIFLQMAHDRRVEFETSGSS
jgi:NAD(P)-dependent dehydrogenase (short-subunit alcohol dehydrogenase family)